VRERSCAEISCDIPVIPINVPLYIIPNIILLTKIKIAVNQRFKFGRGDPAIPKHPQIFAEAGLELGEALMCHLKIDLFSDISL
jgi:hypothetical protein